MTTHVSICIVGFRNTDDIVQCFEALEKTTHHDFEVIICENGGPKAFAELTAVIPETLRGGQVVRAVLADSNLGFPGGVNRCLAETPDADAWWVLNPDTQPLPDALEAMVRRLEVGDCDAVGCTILASTGLIGSYGGRWDPWLARSVSLGMGKPATDPVDAAVIEATQTYIHGAAMLLNRRFLEVVGPMRADYFIYCEEVEWCWRARKRGVKLGFAPNVYVVHHQGTTTGAGGAVNGWGRLATYLGERNRILMVRDSTPNRLPVAAVSALLLILRRYIKAGAWRQLGWGWSGWVDGLQNRRGPPPWLPA